MKQSAPKNKFLRLSSPLLLSYLTLISFLLLLGNFLTPFSSFDEHIQQVLATPLSPFAHLTLAEDFQRQNQTELTKKELAIITRLPTEDTLLLQSEISRLTKLTLSKETLIGNKNILESYTFLFPNYRDLLLKKSVLSWQLKNDNDARALFLEARFLDPNHKQVKEVEELLKID